MILLSPSFEILEQGPGLDGMFKQIEYCGRISHKSEDLITENSHVDFIKKMQKLKHFATFEHGAVYLVIEEDSNPHATLYKDIVDFYVKNPYSKVNHYDWSYYITTNYRVICENGREADLVAYWSEPTEHHEKRYTVIFTCDIGVSREFNRHRVDSILEESTRYCDYTKDKFKNELNIMIPVWLKEQSAELEKLSNKSFKDFCDYLTMYGDETDFRDIDYWMLANACSEYCYEKLIKDFRWTPQQARTILPLDLKTTLAHTAFESDWEHFFDLRALGTTGAPHPSAKELAEPLMKNFIERDYIN